MKKLIQSIQYCNISSVQRTAVIVSALMLTFGTQCASAARALGIDSDFNCCSVDWPTVAANGVQFACIKATAQDEGFQNSVFANRMQGAHAAGIYTIPYNRVNPSTYTPASEAAYFWNFAHNSLFSHGYNLSPAVDIEDGLTGSYKKDGGGTQSLAAWINQYFSDLSSDASAAGLTIKQITYVNVGITCDIGSGLHGYLWLADPCGCNPQTGSPYTCGGCSVSDGWDGCEPLGSESWSIWQYEWSSQESSPPFPGLSERVDINSYNGTLDQMVSALGTTGTKAPPVDDFDGDGAPESVVFRPSNNTWYVRHSTDGSSHPFGFGTNGIIPLLGGVGGSDFDGDGIPDAVYFQTNNYTWYVRFSTTGATHPFPFGTNGDIPLLGGDFDGDGVPDAVLYRPSNDTWLVRLSGDGSSRSIVWGSSTALPLLGDFDGDGVPDLVYVNTNNFVWNIRYSSDASGHSFSFGDPGDIPMVGGDFDGDGKADAVLFRPSNSTWYVRYSGANGAVHSFSFGMGGDIPVLGGDTDGDGVPDAELFRPSNGYWYVRFSGSAGAVHSFPYGINGDIPVR